MSLLEGELAQIIGDALVEANIPYGMEVIETVEGQPDPDRPWQPGQPVDVVHGCQGFTDTYTVHERSATAIQAGDIKIVIVANTLDVVPVPGMRVRARGEAFRVINASPDPALATYVIQGRR